MKSYYDYETAIENILDKALAKLPPALFETLLDSITIMLADYEDKLEEKQDER